MGKYNENEELRRNQVKAELKKYINENGIPENAYYYDGGTLVLEYFDSELEKNVLSDKEFNHWRDLGIYGHAVMTDDFETLLKEVTDSYIPVFAMADRDEWEDMEYDDDEEDY